MLWLWIWYRNLPKKILVSIWSPLTLIALLALSNFDEMVCVNGLCKVLLLSSKTILNFAVMVNECTCSWLVTSFSDTNTHDLYPHMYLLELPHSLPKCWLNQINVLIPLQNHSPELCCKLVPAGEFCLSASTPSRPGLVMLERSTNFTFRYALSLRFLVVQLLSPFLPKTQSKTKTNAFVYTFVVELQNLG